MAIERGIRWQAIYSVITRWSMAFVIKLDEGGMCCRGISALAPCPCTRTCDGKRAPALATHPCLYAGGMGGSPAQAANYSHV